MTNFKDSFQKSHVQCALKEQFATCGKKTHDYSVMGDVMVVGAWGLWEDLIMEVKWKDGQGLQVGLGKNA